LSIHRLITAIAGVGSPLILAYIINYYGGLDLANAIRPVFLLQFASEIVIFIVLYTKLENVFIEKRVGRESLVEGLRLILAGPVPLKLMLVRDVVTMFVMGMCNPFQGIYQVDVKMATVFIFGWIGVAEPAVDILLSIPAGRLIEKYGRRKVGYAGHIAGIVARLLLVLTPRSFPELLILMTALGSLEGCLYLGFDAYGQEIIPQDIRGKWMGVLAVITGVIGVVAPVIGGFIWNVNPNYLFWLNVIQWAFVAFPIMIILIEKYSVDGKIKTSI
jgi:MFS family permease